MGFAIISSEPNYGNLACTVRSIKNNYSTANYLCVTSRSVKSEQYKKMIELCPVFKGKSTVTSLINMALKKSKSEWTLVVMEGTPIHRGIDKKYGLFIENNKDVLFSIIMQYDKQGRPIVIKDTFEDAPLNGMLIHRDTFKEVGDFTDESIPVSKLFWEAKAVDQGCKFKGVIGMRIL